jgi:hypothetical protein
MWTIPKKKGLLWFCDSDNSYEQRIHLYYTLIHRITFAELCQPQKRREYIILQTHLSKNIRQVGKTRLYISSMLIRSTVHSSCKCSLNLKSPSWIDWPCPDPSWCPASKSSFFVHRWDRTPGPFGMGSHWCMVSVGNPEGPIWSWRLQNKNHRSTIIYYDLLYQSYKSYIFVSNYIL